MISLLLQPWKNWQAARRERRIDVLTAQAADLAEGAEVDLFTLHQRGLVSVQGTGQSIQQIYAKIDNQIRKRLLVVIKPGTYFVSAGNHQNMATRREYRLYLSSCGSQNVAIDAACINAGRPIPGQRDRFEGVQRVSPEVAHFLQATERSDPMTIQAGVWALTDQMSGQQVMSRLVLVDQQGNRRQAISAGNVTEARQILSRLGIVNRL